jgi:nicotinamidase-related amidase
MTLADSDNACRNAAKILHDFRAKALPVIYIQHIALNPTATFFLPDTKGAEIHPSLEPLEQDKVIVKHYPNSFRATDLLDYLITKNITELVICGMMTHMCVDATVRAAKDSGFNVTVIGDACATRSLEISERKISAGDVQDSFLAALNYFYSNVITTGEYLDK